MRYLILTDEEAQFLDQALSYQVHCATEMTEQEKDNAASIARKLAQRS